MRRFASKWRGVRRSQTEVSYDPQSLSWLSVISHNTQKHALRRKRCCFTSKLAQEMLSFVSYASWKFLWEKEEEEEERRWQKVRFSLRDFSPPAYSTVPLLVFLVTTRQCKLICSLVYHFCSLFGCILPRSKPRISKIPRQSLNRECYRTLWYIFKYVKLYSCFELTSAFGCISAY